MLKAKEKQGVRMNHPVLVTVGDATVPVTANLKCYLDWVKRHSQCPHPHPRCIQNFSLAQSRWKSRNTSQREII